MAFSFALALFLGSSTAWMLGKTPPWAMVTPARSLFNSSSLRIASWRCLGMMRDFLLSLAALPAPHQTTQQQPSHHLDLPHVADILNQAGSQLIFFQLPDNVPVCMSADVDQITDGTLTGVEGCLGELSIRKSGTCQLILGDSKQEKKNQRFDIEAGTQVGFLQDLVSIRVAPVADQDGEMTVLGHISNRLIVSPNWDSLLQDSGFDRDLA